MRALAWDDEYQGPNSRDDLSCLLAELRDFTNAGELEIVVFKHRGDFIRELETGEPFDYFIVDWFDTTKKEVPSDPWGGSLIQAIRRKYQAAPIFVYSKHTDRIEERDTAGAGLVFFKSKLGSVSVVALDIAQTLRALRIDYDPHRVFLIYGHDNRADGASKSIRQFIEHHGAKVDAIAPENSRSTLLPSLLERMSKCAAFVAVCTPDDQASTGLSFASGYWQPRQNVLFELGIACGLSRNPERITILQKWVEHSPEETAVLPSDFGGYVPLRFANSPNHCFKDLKVRLERLGVFSPKRPAPVPADD